jgi:hypothetical protein
LSPSGLPAMAPQSLAPLEGYCTDSILGYLAKVTVESTAPPYPSLFLATLAAQTASAYPSIPPLLNPASNVTALTPNFYDGSFNVFGYAGASANSTQIKDVLTAFSLSHYLPGVYCPDDFKDGITVQTLAGQVVGKNYSLYIKQDEEDGNMLNVKVLFGNNQSDTEYTATYIGQACYTSVYVLNSFLTPWNAPVADNPDAQIPYEYLPDIPMLENQTDLFGLNGTCRSSFGTGSAIIFSESSPSSSLSGGAIAGIVIGCIVFLLACIAAVWWLLKKRQGKSLGSSSDPTSVEKPVDGSSSNDLSSIGTTTINSQRLSEILEYNDTSAVINELILTESEVSIDIDPATDKPVLLGQGRYGKVFQGTLLGTEPIAIKCILGENLLQTHDSGGDAVSLDGKSLGRNEVLHKSSLGIMSNDQVLREIALLKSCHSQYIVSFMGAMFLAREIRLVTELLPAGDLWKALGRSSCPKLVTWYRGGIFIAMDVVAGLKYLHEKKRVIHLDLKSSNILLRETHTYDGCSTPPSEYSVTHRGKISDVGLSKMLPTSHEYIKDLQTSGTWNWCAPEVILCAKCTPAADMFSFGVVLWEICTGEIPVRGRMRDVNVPAECPQEVADLIHNCLDCSEGRQPRDRPTASEAFEILQKLLRTTTTQD